MTSEVRLCAVLGAVLCFLAVLIGAFGAHALNDLLVANQRKDVFDLANRYQFYHGLAMLALAAVFVQQPKGPSIRMLIVLFATGILIFSGSLYLLALTNIAWLGAITPIGGALLLLAWGAVIAKLRATQI